jgi:tetratricopeptide (TPR) repeat protein
VQNPAKLGEQIGQWAAQIWLYEDNEWTTTKEAFRLALKYYCKKHGHRTDDIKRLHKLATDDFSGISMEFGDPGRRVKRPNLGVGFFVLHLWSEAIQCYQHESKVPPQMGKAYLRLGELCSKDGDVLRAIEFFANATELGNKIGLIRLGAAYQSVGNYSKSISTLEKLDHFANCPPALTLLLQAYYALCKNIPRDISQTLSEFDRWWARRLCGAEARVANDDPEEAEEDRELCEGRGRDNETYGPIRIGKN